MKISSTSTQKMFNVDSRNVHCDYKKKTTSKKGPKQSNASVDRLVRANIIIIIFI